MKLTAFHEAEKEWQTSNPLRKFRAKNSLMQRNIAAAMEVSYHTVYRWEVGMTFPTQEQLEHLGRLMEDAYVPEKWATWLQARPHYRTEDK